MTISVIPRVTTMTRIVSILFCTLGALSLPLFLFASETNITIPVPRMPATVQGTATHFSLTDSVYRNLMLDANVPITVFLQSVPEKITVHIAQSASSTATTTHIILSGLDPNTIYHKYTDRYENHEVITTDSAGTYSFDQSLESPHLVWIQPKKSTKFIFDDAVGSDCISIGNWDSTTKTCTLTSDVGETIEIGGSGITLDGNGHSITGVGTGSGVFIGGQAGVVIKNLTVSHFSDGIELFGSQNTLIENVTISAEGNSGIAAFQTYNTQIWDSHITAVGTQITGIFILSFSTAPPFAFGTDIENNIISGAYTGISISNQDGGVIRGNSILDAKYIGLTSSRMYNFLIRNNNFSRGIFVSGTSDIDQSNVVDGKSIINLYNQIGGVFDGTLRPIGQFFCTSCSNITVKNANLTNLAYGAAFIGGNGDTVSNSNLASNTIAIYFNESGLSRGNTFDSNETGIFFDGADGGLVEGNMFLNQTGRAIFTSQQHVIIRNNSFENNELTFDLRNGPSSKFYNNNVYSGGRMWGKPIADNGLPDGGNYWAGFSVFCPDVNFNKICDVPFSHSESDADQFTDNYPWTEPNAWPSAHPTPPTNTPPRLSNLGQFKMFGVDSVSEGSTFVGNTIVLKGIATDTDSTSTSIEFEIKQATVAFNGVGVVVSSSTNATSSAQLSVVIDPLIPKDDQYLPGGNAKSFHWRARAVDSDGNKSEWKEFGTSNNTDFSVKVVPLWTQNPSNFPTRVTTADEWSNDDYDLGKATDFGDCGKSIRQCGCAITSSVMVAHYYQIDTAQNSSVTPRTLNVWLQSQSDGYFAHGVVNWAAISRYTGYQMVYKPDERYDTSNSNNTPAEYTRLDGYVNNLQPVIAKADGVRARGGITRTHFFVVDQKLASTYGVRDPFWFNTKTLNEAHTDNANFVRAYENGFDGLRIFAKGNGIPIAMSEITLALGSPAELLITDPQGRRTGKTSATSSIFTEIPGSEYYTESIGDPAGFGTTSVQLKILRIKNPQPSYILQVTGTGNGSYSLEYLTHGSTTTYEKATSTISSGSVVQYTITYSATNTNSDLRPSFAALIGTFKSLINNSSLKPLIKTAHILAITGIEDLYKKKKFKETQLAIDLLSTAVKLQRGKDMSTSIAEQLLKILADLKLYLQ